MPAGEPCSASTVCTSLKLTIWRPQLNLAEYEKCRKIQSISTPHSLLQAFIRQQVNLARYEFSSSKMTQRYGDYYGGGLAIEKPAAKRLRLDQWQSDYASEYLPSAPEVYPVSQSDGFGGDIHQESTLEGSWVNFLTDQSQVHDITNPSVGNQSFIQVTEQDQRYHTQSHSPWDAPEVQDPSQDWLYHDGYQQNSPARSVAEEDKVLADEATPPPVDQVCFGMVCCLKKIKCPVKSKNVTNDSRSPMCR
jgi:hypothetical protein